MSETQTFLSDVTIVLVLAVLAVAIPFSTSYIQVVILSAFYWITLAVFFLKNSKDGN